MSKRGKPRLQLSSVVSPEGFRCSRCGGHYKCPDCLRLLAGKLVQDWWLEVPLSEGWIAAYRLVPKDGWPIVGEVRVFPLDESVAPGRRRSSPGESHTPEGLPIAEVPPGGLSGRILRMATPVRALDELSRIMAEWDTRERELGDLSKPQREFEMSLSSWEGSPDRMSYRFSYGLAEATRDARGRRRPGVKGWPDSHYAAIAQEYVRLCGERVRSPLAELARLYPLMFPTREAARDSIKEARQRGLLTTPPKSGVAGGTLTEKCKATLASAGTTPLDERAQRKGSKHVKEN